MNFIRAYWIEYGRAIISCFGVLFLFLESAQVTGLACVLRFYNYNFSIWEFLALIFVPGTIWFWFNGTYLNGFLTNAVTIKFQQNGLVLTLKFADLLAERGVKAIAVNDFFDSIVDDEVIAKNSLHGKVVGDIWPSEQQWDRDISVDLATINPKEVVSNRAVGKKSRYAIGTTALASHTKHEDYLFVAFGETNPDTHKVRSDARLFILALTGLFQKARICLAGKPLCVPLMGTNFANIGVHPSAVIDLMIVALLEENAKGKITNEIFICIHPSLKKSINLRTHKSKWVHSQ